MNKPVSLIIGSDSDLKVIKAATDFFEEMQIGYSINISSAHRAPEKTIEIASMAESCGVEVIIAAAGGAAHLAGVIAAHTVLPVIGIPIKNDSMFGVDALFSTVQMPAGIPVATVAINGARNAAILAAQILGVKSTDIRAKLHRLKNDLAASCQEKDSILQQVGVDGYLSR